MKKHLTSILSFAVTMFMAFTASFTLTSCGEEVSIEGPGSSEEGMTVFSSVSDGTRTTMDADGLFYWQSMTSGGNVTRDQIWVDKAGTGASFSLPSASSQFEPDNRTGKFFFGEQLSADSYKLSYTGFGSSTGDKVTISAEQQQSKWNNSDHIGTSGDCATATATKGTDGNYTFTLNHKSSYLIFKPYAPAATATNIYRLTEIMITDTDGNALAGIFPLKYDGLKTDGASNTTNQIRLTCNLGFKLPAAASDDCIAYAVMLPRGYRNLRVAYSVSSTSDGNFQVYENISGTYEANSARLIEHELSVPVVGPGDPDPNFIVTPTDANRRFGGVKFKPAFLFRTSGDATTSATLQLKEMKDDPFILLQYNQPDNGNTGSAITEFDKRMFFNWNELAEIFGHADQGQGANWATTAATAANITNSITIGGKQYKLPSTNQYSKLIETPNSGRATVNYYPASFASVRVDLSADATYSNKGWNHTKATDQSATADYIMGYLFFPDESVILASKIKVASLNGRWDTTYSDLTAEELKAYTAHGCMFLPAAGDFLNTGWYHRGTSGHYWSGTRHASRPSQVYRFGFGGIGLNVVEASRSYDFATVLVEN